MSEVKDTVVALFEVKRVCPVIKRYVDTPEGQEIQSGLFQEFQFICQCCKEVIATLQDEFKPDQELMEKLSSHKCNSNSKIFKPEIKVVKSL